MDKYNWVYICIILLLVIGCQSTSDTGYSEVKKVTISNSEVFEYRTGISGDEEGASIAQQPEHSELSEIVRNSDTQWEAVYKYKANEGFEGIDQVELKLSSGSDGATPNTHVDLVKIEFTVN